MIRWVEKILQQKNPHFKFDEAVDFRLLLALLWRSGWKRVRGFRLLFYGQWPTCLFLGRGVRLFNVRNIRFGKWVQLEDQVFLQALGKEPIVFGNNVTIGAYSRVIISTSFNNMGKGIRIGNNVGIGEFAYLGGAGGLEIGDDCIIGQYLSCHPENHSFSDEDTLYRLQGVDRKGIRIGSNCWIGAKVTVLDGVEIGDNCVVAAGAVVTKSMPANSLIGGVPARVIRSLKKVSKDLILETAE